MDYHVLAVSFPQSARIRFVQVIHTRGRSEAAIDCSTQKTALL